MSEPDKIPCKELIALLIKSYPDDEKEFITALLSFIKTLSWNDAKKMYDEAKAAQQKPPSLPPALAPPPADARDGLLGYSGRRAAPGLDRNLFAPRSAAPPTRRAVAPKKVKSEPSGNVNVEVIVDFSACEAIKDDLKDKLKLPRKTQVHGSALQRVELPGMGCKVPLHDLLTPRATNASLVQIVAKNIGFDSDLAVIADEQVISLTDVTEPVRIRNLLAELRDASCPTKTNGFVLHHLANNKSQWLVKQFFDHGNITATAAVVKSCALARGRWPELPAGDEMLGKRVLMHPLSQDVITNLTLNGFSIILSIKFPPQGCALAFLTEDDNPDLFDDYSPGGAKYVPRKDILDYVPGEADADNSGDVMPPPLFALIKEDPDDKRRADEGRDDRAYGGLFDDDRTETSEASESLLALGGRIPQRPPGRDADLREVSAWKEHGAKSEKPGRELDKLLADAAADALKREKRRRDAKETADSWIRDHEARIDASTPRDVLKTAHCDLSGEYDQSDPDEAPDKFLKLLRATMDGLHGEIPNPIFEKWFSEKSKWRWEEFSEFLSEPKLWEERQVRKPLDSEGFYGTYLDMGLYGYARRALDAIDKAITVEQDAEDLQEVITEAVAVLELAREGRLDTYHLFKPPPPLIQTPSKTREEREPRERGVRGGLPRRARGRRETG